MRHSGRMDTRIVIVDPFESEELVELAELSGVPFTSVRTWHFSPTPADRVVTTVPLPRGVARQALGVGLGVDVPPRVGESWPDRVVSLRHGREDILAWLGGSEAPGGRLVGVVGLAGGLGTTTLAAGLARSLAQRPLTIALLDSDPVSGLAQRLGLAGGQRWADFAAEPGPLLPHRLDSVLPVWQRVRVATGDHRGTVNAPFAPVAHALARTHDVTIVDLPRSTLAGETDLACCCGDVVVVLGGRTAEVDAWHVLRGLLPAATTLHAVVRTGGEMGAGEVARELGTPVVALGTERDTGPAVQPGDRRRGAVMTAAHALAARLA